MQIRSGACGILLAAACQSPSTVDGGVETGPCVDYQCFQGLVCLSNLCVDPGDGTTGPVGSATTTGDGQTASGSSTSDGDENVDESTGDAIIQVTISPSDPLVWTTTDTQFTAAVTGTDETAVTWSLTDPRVGEVSPSGEYMAPLHPGVVQLRATSVADPTVMDTVTITIEDRAGKMDESFFGTRIDGGAEAAREAVLGEDGSIYIAGYHSLSIILLWHMAVLKVQPDGGIDTDFGTNGLLRIGPQADLTWGDSLMTRGAGEMIVGGSSEGTMLAAVTTDGELVPEFGVGGIENVLTGPGAVTLAPVPPGRFVAGGDEQILLFEEDGTVVATFGGDGSVETTIPAAWAAYWPYAETYEVTDVLVQPDGRILVLGVSDPSGGDVGAMVLARLIDDGELDPTFGMGGVALYAKDDYAAMHPDEMLLLDDGRIVVSGSHDGAFFVARMLADGTLDTSFGADGWVQHIYERNVALPLLTGARAIERLPDGSFVVLCSIGGSLAGVLRMSAEGEVDLSFGDDVGDGWGLLDTGIGDDILRAVDLHFQPPGRLIAVVNFHPNLVDNESIAVYALHVY